MIFLSDITTLAYGALALIIILTLVNKLTTWEHIVPLNIPWIDRRAEPFSYLRAKWRSFLNMRQNMTTAYYTVNKQQGRAAAIAIAFGRPQIVLPPKYVRWIATQPDTVLSMDPINDEFHYFLRDGLVGDLLLNEALRRKLSQYLPELIAEMSEEIVLAVDKVLGSEEEWRALPLRDTMRTIAARVSNRLFVGTELCRNEDYVRHAVGLGMAVMPQTLVQDLLPRVLKFPLSFATKLFTRISLAGITKHLVPVIRQRIRDIQTIEKDQLPRELLTWLAQRALQRGESPASLEHTLVARIAVVNLAAIETTVKALTTCLEDIAADTSRDYLALMKDEAHSVLSGCYGPGGGGAPPTKADVDKLVHIDRALKESLRLGMVLPGLIRQVTAPNGVTLDDGTHLRCGARISVAAYGIHRDEENWPDATTYNPSRHEGDSLPMSRGTEKYLAFSMGRRACPGRFFVSDEMKLLTAYIITRYEIKVVKPPVTKVGLVQELTMRGPQEQLLVRRIK
ncbi:cytochrome P450 [Aspergillus keveii]|uniref:Cytochrome P450 n=1 Tax=Aspergillus keveii TaxID=714993 RepID=A0ABR4GE49_9EURO